MKIAKYLFISLPQYTDLPGTVPYSLLQGILLVRNEFSTENYWEENCTMFGSISSISSNNQCTEPTMGESVLRRM